jgi:hypothetical protein
MRGTWRALSTIMRKALGICLVILSAATSVFAQDDKRVEINLGGGATFPLSTYKDSFDTGGLFAAGATFWVTPMIGIQGEYNYDRMNGPSKTINVSPTPGGGGSNQLIESNQQINAGLFDVVARSQTHGAVNGYVLGGLGIYHRQVQLTSPAVGYTTICDPYWLICYPAAVSVDNILGSRSSTDFGINFGGGVTFGHEAKFYVEARYHYVYGPTVNPPAGIVTTTTTKLNAQFFPLIFGVRF